MNMHSSHRQFVNGSGNRLAWRAPLLALLVFVGPLEVWAATAAADRAGAAPPVSLSGFRTLVAGSDQEILQGFQCPWSDCRSCAQYRRFCGGAASDSAARAARAVTETAGYRNGAGASQASAVGLGTPLATGTQVPQQTSATFIVSKVFEDGNDGEVDVRLSCATGLPLEQTASISEGHSVAFVVTEFGDGTLYCTVSETDVPGYTAEYLSTGSDSERSDDAGGCHFSGAQLDDTNLCQVSNSPDAVVVEITQEWVIEGAATDIDTRYEVRLVCASRIVEGFECAGAPGGVEGLVSNGVAAAWCRDFQGSGDAVFLAEVIPGYPSSTCSVYQSVLSSAVESRNGCGTFAVGAGEDFSCTIVNTLFFESIPALSRMGLIVLILLTAGVGLAAVRRMA